MKKYTLPACTALVITMLLYGCQISTSDTWKGGNIDGDVRNEINALNKKLLQNIKADNVAGVKEMMSQVLIDSAGSKIDMLINNPSRNLTGDSFDIIDEYYVKNTTTNI